MLQVEEKSLYLHYQYQMNKQLYSIQQCVKFGHYNAIGYRQMALFIANQINKVMTDNIDDFMDIDWIPIIYKKKLW